MSIAWNYLDKRSAAMAALKDYRSMKAILATTAEEIANVRQDMVRIGGMRFEESAHGARNPQAGENQILHGIAEIDGLRISVSGFEFANFSAMMRARNNDRRFAE